MDAVGAAHARSYDRRRDHRVPLAVPMQLSMEAAEGGGLDRLYDGVTTDLGTGGLYLTTSESRLFAPGDAVTVFVAIPWKDRRHFPFSRIAGLGRVVRVDRPATPNKGHAQGLALAFCEGQITLMGTSATP